MNRETMVIAHRGASALAPHENTLEAFQIAIDLKADMVEFDVRKTSDNILIVFHDGTIDGRYDIQQDQRYCIKRRLQSAYT